jgi:hypothetical protein
MIEPRTFRATAEAWLGKLLLPVVFFILLTLTAVKHSGLNMVAAGVGVFLLLLLAATDYVLPMLRTWVTLDERTIEGSVNGRTFRIYWTEVLAAWVSHCKGRRYLCIGIKDGTLILPLRFMDQYALWKMVRVMVRPEALEESAILKLPDFREWVDERDKAACLGGEPRAVSDHWAIQVVCWGGMAFSAVLAFGFYRAGDFASTALLAGMIGLCALLITRWGINEIGPEAVARSTMFSSSSIQWSEVRWIEIDPLNSVIVLVGDECQLAISGPGLWSGADKLDALSIIISQAEHRKIPLRRTFGALLRTTRRARAYK